MSWNNWTILGFGIWFILSPWILGFSDLNIPTWNNIFMGSLIIALALWNFTPEE